MTIFVLQIRATLENVAKLTPIPNNLWKFHVVNSSGERREGITVSASDDIALEGSRGVANFVMKWPGSKQQSYIKIVSVSKCDEYTNQNGEFVSIVGFECRGLELETWIPSCDFSVETLDGVRFEEVDLSDPDGWAEYDEQNDKSISVTELGWRIVRT